MPVYDRNLLPDTYDTNWVLSDATKVNSNTGIKFNSADGTAVYSYNTTGFEATGYMLITCTSVVGDAFLCIEYIDAEDNVYNSHVIRLTTDLYLTIVLQEATVDSTIAFTLYTSTANSQVDMVEALLMEQAIRSVDIEYASGTSRVTPPEEGWSTSAPQWQTGYYIWQRTATTFVDGHTEYSDPICIQDTESAGIYALEEQFYLSTSDQSPTGGSWSTTQPTWQTGRYIWTRSQITWTDQSVTYSDPVLAQALNQANERAEEAIDAVEDLDKNLDQDGIFNRLTNNGQSQGLFLDNGDVYINATYINTGILTVRDTNNYTLFRADITDKSVYIAGFTVENSSLHAGSCVFLGDTSTGVYIGTDGITSGQSNSRHITMGSGELYGGHDDYSYTGYINFANYWIPDGTYACRIGGAGGIFLLAPRLGVADYQHGGELTASIGQSGFVSVPNADNMNTNRYVTNLQSNGSGGYTWTNYYPGSTGVSFRNGLMITAL